MRFTRNEDELALIAGHELAHVIAGTPKRSGLFGRRVIEDKADLFGAELAQCAGYDVVRGIKFWSRYHKYEVRKKLNFQTHRSAQSREDRLREAAPSLRCRKLLLENENS